MKKLILISAAIIFIGFTAYAQNGISGNKWLLSENSTGPLYSRDLRFDIHGHYDRTVKKEKLKEAKSLSDFIPG